MLILCSKCGLKKDIYDFYKGRNSCKECDKIYKEENREKILEYHKKYDEENKEKISEYQKKYREENKEKISKKRHDDYIKNKEKISEYYKKRYKEDKEKILNKQKERYANLDNKKERNKIKNEKNKEYRIEYYQKNKDKILEDRKEYYQENIDRIKEYRESKSYKERKKESRSKREKNKRIDNPVYYLSEKVRGSIKQSFKSLKCRKNSLSVELLGCSFEEFKIYIESKFESWMTWDNKGLYNGEPNYGWDLDHIIPLSSVKTEEDIIKLNHYTNFQPLCSYINRYVKRDRLDF